MSKERKHTKYLFITIVLFGLSTFFFTSCVNDIKEIERIANIQEEEAVDISKDVVIVYSDSARVKAELSAPEMRIYHDSTGNYEFQQGVEIIFFDEQGIEAQRIRSDYAIQHQSRELTEFRDNVVVTMADGSVIKTEELFHDESKKIYYNTVPIVFFFSDNRGDLHATSFTSDLDFQKIDGKNMTGYTIIKDDSNFPSFGQ